MSNVSTERRWVAPLLEFGVSCGAALAYFATCYLIKVHSLDRKGQVSALAALGYRFMLFALPLVVALIAVAKYRPAWWNLAVRLVCAAFAGLVSAMLAGGILGMLRGTLYGLGGETGDSAVLAKWTEQLITGEDFSVLYPPLQIHLIAWISKIQGVEPIYAIKYFQILGVLAFGPAVYGSWRLLLRPTWALGLGIVAALPLLEAYRQYPLLVLGVFLPLAIKFLDTLRRSPELPRRSLVVRGLGFGVVFGVLFLLYSGWFQWSAPGFFVTAIVVFPWRRAPRDGFVLCATALFAFLAVGGWYLLGVLGAPPLRDDFYYFDARIEPMYIAMWRGGLPGTAALIWPPPGELGGVGLFTVILCAGWAASLIVGARHTAVMAVSWIMVGAWFLRLYHAHRMAQLKLIQLYPRTTAELLYCLTVVTGYAVYLYIERRCEQEKEPGLLRAPSSFIGVLCGLALLFMSVGSAVTDRYMPTKELEDVGHMSWLALTTIAEGHNKTSDGTAEATSASDQPDHAAALAIDLDRTTYYESALSDTPDHEEWIQIELNRATRFSQITLVPAGEGFPVDFTIELWDSRQWVTRVTRTGYQPSDGPQTFTWGRREFTGRIRLHATKLGRIGDKFGLRLAEFEVYQMASR